MKSYVAIGKQVYPQEQSFRKLARTVFEKGVTVVVLEICLSEKALIEVECNLERVDNGGKSALLNIKETAMLYDFVN